MSDEITTINQILQQVGLSSPGIRYIILMDRTGMMVSSFKKYVFKELELDSIGAIIGAALQAGEAEGVALEFTGFEIQITEFKDGFRFAVACEDIGVLAVISDKDVQIGLIRASMKKYAPALAKLLRKMFSSPSQSAMEDLKDLFSSDSGSFM